MKKFTLITSLLIVSAVATLAYANKILADHTHSDLPSMASDPSGLFDMGHSGGLDKNGGHYDRKTGSYHYHR